MPTSKRKPVDETEGLRRLSETLAYAGVPFLPGKQARYYRDHMDEATNEITKKLQRVIAATRAQFTSIDPETGETYVVPTKPGQKIVPGLVYDTASLGMLLPGEHTWADEAGAKADAIRAAKRAEFGLGPPEGLADESAEMLGTMLGQLPLPAGTITRAGKGAASATKTLAASPLEYLSPTIEPSVANYLSGTAGGLGVSHLIDSLSPYQPTQSEVDAYDELARRYLTTGRMVPKYSKGGQVTRSALNHMKSSLEKGEQFPDAAKKASDKFDLNSKDVLEKARKKGLAPDPAFLAKGGKVAPLVSAAAKAGLPRRVLDHLNEYYAKHGPTQDHEEFVNLDGDDVQHVVSKKLLIDPNDSAASILAEMHRIHNTDPKVLESSPIPNFWEGDTLGDQLRRLSKYFEENSYALED